MGKSMTKNLCNTVGCANNGKYARYCGHLADEDTPQESREKVYLKVRKEFIKGKTCEFPDCKKLATDIHHSRGRRGDMLTDTRYFKALCRGHHLRVEAKPNEAKQLGLTESRHKK
jgi:hypothetical protein